MKRWVFMMLLDGWLPFCTCEQCQNEEQQRFVIVMANRMNDMRDARLKITDASVEEILEELDKFHSPY